jgi:hypothetical protein
MAPKRAQPTRAESLREASGEAESSTTRRQQPSRSTIEDNDGDEGGVAATPVRVAGEDNEDEVEDIEEDPDVKELIQRRARLAPLLRKQRLAAEVRAMEEEVAGEQPSYYVEVAGTSLPTRKRHRSNSPTADRDELLKIIRITKPKSFSSQSMKQLHSFNSSWETTFESIPYDIVADWAFRIRTAANYLEGRAMDEWRRDRRDNIPIPVDWQTFITWCKDTIEDADVRKGEALDKLAGLKQTAQQSVRDLVHTMELLEEEIGSITEDERKGWALFHALTPRLRDAVRRDLKTITSRAQVLASAQRLESTVLREKPADRTQSARHTSSPREHTRTLPHRGGRSTARETLTRSERSSPSPSKKPRGPSPARDQGSFRGRCYNCHQDGHIREDCPNPKASTAAVAQVKRMGYDKDKGRPKNGVPAR